MTNTILTSPFRCKMWDFHDRLEYFIDENSCRTEINSFSQHGQLVPAIGRPLRGDPDYDIELISGARRLYIARHLNVPLCVELREVTDRAAAILLDIENRQRQDISPYERGLWIVRCLRAGYFRSQEDLAKALKISQPQVSRLIALAALPTVVIKAFNSPLEMREVWGLELSRAMQDPSRRAVTIARARRMISTTTKPLAPDVYKELICAPMIGRRVRARHHDEVVTDIDGFPLFRVRTQKKTVAFVLTMTSTSAETLAAVRDSVRNTLRQARQSKTPGDRLRRSFVPKVVNSNGRQTLSEQQ